MLKTIESFVALASRVDDKVVGVGGAAGAQNGENVGGSDTSGYPPIS